MEWNINVSAFFERENYVVFYVAMWLLFSRCDFWNPCLGLGLKSINLILANLGQEASFENE